MLGYTLQELSSNIDVWYKMILSDDFKTMEIVRAHFEGKTLNITAACNMKRTLGVGKT